MKNYLGYVRIILSLLLLYGVYTETGVWTTVAMGLILIETEISGYAKKHDTKSN